MDAYEEGFRFTGIDDETAGGRISFHYELRHKGIATAFTETLEFAKPTRKVNRAYLDVLLRRLHILLGISYWKTRIPKTLILPYSVSRNEADFWNTVYTKGLGEFFYKNKLDFRGLVQFPFRSDVQDPAHPPQAGGGHPLVLLGGGKDSVVAGEALKQAGRAFSFFALNAHPVQMAIAKAAGVPLVTMTRTLDPKLFSLNTQEGVYNGHVPVSAIYALTGLLAAELYGHGAVIAANERSANYGNVSYLGSEINHQWSKSFEFETGLQQYYPHYFSLLRPLTEFRIVEIFSRYPKYFPLFTSCNRNFTREGSDGILWCGECAKCAFVFLLLSAFLPKETLVAIFGNNLYDKESLRPMFEELLGVRAIKPFDCVGTPEEAQEALLRAYESGAYRTSSMVGLLASSCVHHPEVSDLSDEHSIPSEFRPVIKNL